LTRLTDFSRPLVRHASRLDLTDHKWSITTSSGREKPAFGGTIPPIWCVAELARYTVSRYAPRLPEWPDLSPSNGSIITSFGIMAPDKRLGVIFVPGTKQESCCGFQNTCL